MFLHLFNGSIVGTSSELLLLEEIAFRLIDEPERERFDEELTTKHYLKKRQRGWASAAVCRRISGSMGSLGGVQFVGLSY